jgi:hypothetical protein
VVGPPWDQASGGHLWCSVRVLGAS